MAPSYRNRDRRQNRPVDHDVFEGLPVRHWRRDYVTVAPPVVQENNTSKNDMWAVELPHGMPKDYHLLPQHSQDLLRAARSGRIYKRPAPVEEDEVDPEAGEKPDKKEEDPKDKGFSAKAWKQVPRHLEGPDVEYLAKRRKGIVTIDSKAPRPVPTVTKATVKRVDAAGNAYVQDVVVPHGQRVEGEVLSQTEIPDPSAASAGATLVHPTPPKRKASSRKKAKGTGRGKKKKSSAPTSVPVASELEGVAALPNESQPGAESQDGVKIESDGTTQVTQSEDIEMHDGSAAASENDDSDEEDGDDEEGSGDEHASPSKAPNPDSPLHHSHPASEPLPILPHVDTTVVAAAPPKSTVKENPFGSPLKNVAMTSSALASPLEAGSDGGLPAPIDATPITDQNLDEATQISQIEENMQEEVADVAPAILPPVPPKPTAVEAEAVAEERRAEEEEEEMLLDIVDGAGARLAEPVSSETVSQNIAVSAPPAPEPISIPAESIAAESIPGSAQAQEGEQLPNEHSEKQTEAAPPAGTGDADDDFPDLLGGLEKSLERPAAEPAVEEAVEEAGSAAEEPAAEASGKDPTPDDSAQEPAPATEVKPEGPAISESAPTEEPAKEE